VTADDTTDDRARRGARGVARADAGSPVRMRGRLGELARVFLVLGTTSFGGPIAHLGYFREQFVARRRWLAEEQYGGLVALSQFLPGPASSQVGFGVGLIRGGGAGALLAFALFTLPSAALMVAFAAGAPLIEGAAGRGALAGLAIVAVAIVAQAVWAMARSLAPDARRASIAVVAALAALLVPGPPGQLIAIGVGVVAGLVWCRGLPASPSAPLAVGVSRTVGVVCLAVFVLLLVGLPAAAALTGDSSIELASVFYGSGALVFGGGHVVLPLLEAGVVAPGWVSQEQFVTGYGAAQAVPGPLFTFAAYLGALSDVGPGGPLGAAIALAAIFAPGFLLLVGALPFWAALQSRPTAQAAVRGANAAVVGILAAALYSPVFTTAITSAAAFALALVCFVLLIAWKAPPWAVVLLGAAGGALIAITPLGG